MIEVIYKEEAEEEMQEAFAMPRNVRQIGLANEDYRIYIEDYVYTFLNVFAAEQENEESGKVAVLTGEIRWTADMTCIFVKGALAADEMDAATDHIDFLDKIWQKLQEDKEKYFPDQEIVGWFFAQQQMEVEMRELFVKVHLRHFGGEKILMLMNQGEREDAFFRYDGGTMAKVSGYYIYYEKNSQMQTYMIERSQNEGQNVSEKVEDKAVRSFRKIIDEKKPEKEQEEKTSVFSYVATICLALAVLAFGGNFYQNRQEGEKVSEISVETSAVTAQMTPVITEGQQKVKKTPVPTERATEEKKISVTPGITGKAVEKTENNKKSIVKKDTETEKTGQTENKSAAVEKKEASLEIPSQETSSEAVRETYVIRPGDTLYQISLSRYGTVAAMEQICALNGISANEIIYPGQVIVLP